MVGGTNTGLSWPGSNVVPFDKRVKASLLFFVLPTFVAISLALLCLSPSGAGDASAGGDMVNTCWL